MPDKEGSDDEKKSTKSVVNKKQKQMMGEEGYDIARDMGKVSSSKDKKDATTMPVSDEVKKTQKKSKGKSAVELVKAKYGKSVMNVGKKKVQDEFDLTKVAEAFGGYIVNEKLESLTGNPEEITKKIKKAYSKTKKTSNTKNDLDTSQGVKDELGSNLGNKAQQDAAKDALLDVINQQPKRTKPSITGDSGQRDRPRVTGDVQTTKTRAPRKGVDYFFDPKKAKADRERTAAKRKEYGIDDKGNVTDAGVEKFARKSLSRKQQASGSNVPIELSKSDLDTAREKLVGGKPVMGMGDKGVKDKVIGTTTGKYGGTMSPKASEKEMKQTQAYLKKRGLTKSFTGKPPSKDEVKPKKDTVTVNTTDTEKVATPKPESKKGVFSTIKKFAKDNPVTALATYDLGKGILGKLMKVKGAVPGVVGGTVGRRSARGGGGL